MAHNTLFTVYIESLLEDVLGKELQTFKIEIGISHQGEVSGICLQKIIWVEGHDQSMHVDSLFWWDKTSPT